MHELQIYFKICDVKIINSYSQLQNKILFIKLIDITIEREK